MDRRVKYTKSVIEDTFLSLLEKKDIGSITVTEICEIADINRATFYRYYIDIYDLLKNIQDNFINEIKASNALINLPDYTVYDFTYEILEIFIKNKQLIKILFDTTNSVYFLNEVLEIAYDKCSKKWFNNFPDTDEEEIEYATVYIFNGALGVINYWIKNNFDRNIEDISRDIEKLTLDGIRKYVKRK
jgi:AcrR family transcriptional regulator